MKSKPSQKGFTTLELAIVLLIFGLIMGTVLAAFSLYNKQQVSIKTDDSIENSNSTILNYLQTFGVYPCPADPSLGPGDPMYGVEQRNTAPNYANINYDSQPCLLASLDQVDGIDANQDGIANDKIVVGAIPFKTLTDRISESEFTESETIDGFGRKLTYAVSQSMTDRDTFRIFDGSIDVVEENDRSLLDENEVDANNNGVVDPAEDTNNNGVFDPGRYAHFVLISHGENGRGAFTRAGVKVQNCILGVTLPPTLPVGASVKNETENCDYQNVNDGVFLSGLRNERDDSYNDDKLKFTLFQNSSLWRSVGGSAITNTNPGNVGMGTDNPQEQLHVNRNITAIEVQGTRFTDRNGNNPVPPQSIGGDNTNAISQAMNCGPGEVAQEIGSTLIGGQLVPRVVCVNPWGTTTVPDLTCPVVGTVQYAMYGFEPTGNAANPIKLLCCNPLGGADPCPQ